MYRTTGDPQYLSLLKKAIALRDSVKEGMDDNQDSIPLREHEKIIGHAVRANYLYAGVADLCLEEADAELQEVLHKVWKSLVTTKLYVTGGCGALYNGASPYGYFFKHQLVHQAYGYEYQLPNVTAYNETCASVGGVYWAWRMFCLEKKPEYADVLERMVLNVNLAGVSMDGKKFFYENMLRRAKKLSYELIWGQERAEYILSYCCPPNLARLMAQLSEYAYGVDEGGIYTVLYGESRAKVTLPGQRNAQGKSGQRSFTVIQETAYPYDGKVRFTFEDVAGEVPEGGEGAVSGNGTEGQGFILHLRIPAWAKDGSVEVRRLTDGHVCQAKVLTRALAGSYLEIPVEDPADVEVLLDLGMEARLTCAHAMVEENGNQVAVERGPLVYCLEGVDADMETLDDLLVPSDICLEPEPFEIEGRQVLSLKGTFLKRKTRDEARGDYDRDALYQEYMDRGYEKIQARMIPYFAWDNRGMGEMRVWLPVTDVRTASATDDAGGMTAKS